MDVGIWLLSDRAVELLVEQTEKDGKISYYDMYAQVGPDFAMDNLPAHFDFLLSRGSVGRFRAIISALPPRRR